MTVIITAIVTFDQCLVYAPSEENIMFGESNGRGNTYVYYESSENAGVYKLNEKNKLMASVTGSTTDLWDGGKVIGLVCSTRNVYLATRTQSGIKIYSWDEDLETSTTRTIPLGNDVLVAGIAVKGEKFYIVAIEDQGRTVKVYYPNGKDNRLEAVCSESAPAGTRYLDGQYVNDKLETLLSDGTRTPGYTSSKIEESELPENVGFMGISMGFSTVTRNVLVMAAVIFLFVFFFRSVIFKRNYVWLKIYGFMILVSLCLFASVYVVSEPLNGSLLEERVVETEYILDVYGRNFSDYDGSVGTTLYDDAYRMIGEFNRNSVYTIDDICIVSLNDNRAYITVSTMHPYGEWLSQSWGEEVDNCIKKSHSSDSAFWGKTELKGMNYIVVITPVTDDAASRCFLAALVRCEDIIAKGRLSIASFIFFMLIIWGVALVLILFISFLRARELRQLSSTLKRVVGGEVTEVIKPRAGSVDFEGMWNAASELSKTMGRRNYLSNQTLAVVSRFAPQNIEHLLGKEALEDVRLGDRGSVKSTVALIELSRPLTKNRSEYSASMAASIEIISKYKNEYSGVLIGDSASMCSSRVLFAKDESGTIAFGTKTIEALKKSDNSPGRRALILLHRTDYEYGITGSQDQYYTCISSTQLDTLSGFVPKLMDLGLRLVASEEALAVNNGDYFRRFIGYLELNDSGSVRLYEILDAAPVDERNRKKEASEVFGKALELYYASDFYLARNNFAEAVKICPEDLVARWYLFRCEKMLDDGKGDQFGFGLLSK